MLQGTAQPKEVALHRTWKEPGRAGPRGAPPLDSGRPRPGRGGRKGPEPCSSSEEPSSSAEPISRSCMPADPRLEDIARRSPGVRAKVARVLSCQLTSRYTKRGRTCRAGAAKLVRLVARARAAEAPAPAPGRHARHSLAQHLPALVLRRSLPPMRNIPEPPRCLAARSHAVAAPGARMHGAALARWAG
jgi:hypothetical protein